MESPILRFDPHSLPRPHSLPLAGEVRLAITRGRVQQRVRQVRGRVFLIGTASDCDLVLGDLQFPEAYAYLFVGEDGVTIRRLGSGPELVVEGQGVETAELVDGDRIGFGAFELEIQMGGRIDGPRTRREDSAEFARPAIGNGQDSADAVEEVRCLVADIRRALAEDGPGLRVFDGYGELAAGRERATA